MGMTSTGNGSLSGSVVRRCALTAAVAIVASSLVAGCGGGDKEAEAAAEAAAERAKAESTVAATPPANADDKHSRLAEAVADGKTTAPVNMRYDLLSKPALGQPFEVELSFETRLPADSLDIVLTEAPGLVIVGNKTVNFTPVEGGQTYTTKVLVQGDKPGLYYIGIVANMATKVQTESRAFAIPVVVGDAPAAQKPTPQTDASGQAIQSMPAQEPK